MKKLHLQKYTANSSNPVIIEVDLEGDVAKIGNTNGISDGNNDMYDGGNYINTNLLPYIEENGIPYTHTQQEDREDPVFLSDGVIKSGNGYFGSGSSYFTNMYSGLFVLAASNISITSFSINGELGADGEGTSNYGDFPITGWTVYWKTIHDGSVSGGDPRIHHMILVPGNGSGITHNISEDTNEDYDEITGSIPDKVYYLLFATSLGSATASVNELQDIASVFVSLNHESLESTLSELNESHQNITDEIPNIYIFVDDGRDEIGLRYPKAAVCLGWEPNDDFRNTYIVYCEDSNAFYRIKNEEDGNSGVVEFLKPFPFEIEGMAYIGETIYAVVGYIPFLIKMDKDCNILNEIEDEKFDTVLSEQIYGLFSYENQLYGVNDDGVVFLIDRSTGECIEGTGDEVGSYQDFCEKGTFPPPLENWLSGNEDEIELSIINGEFIDRDLEIQWNPSGYGSYGNPPSTNWTTVSGIITNPEEGGGNIVIALPTTDITIRVRYINENSEWKYIYLD
jgi:hypothetical protein